ncbi:DUF1877 family protein [Spirillospora sp. CA-294931]|uniref:DUF1877 family protein n=1 Tax=Spirillospora sp. CA-294931 TaxID=3240042 RepID=UPI003D929038
MGIDLSSVPVLLDSEPVRAIRCDAGVFEAASWRPPFYFGDEDFGEPLPEVSRAMMAGRPAGLDALEGPWHSGARDYGQAEYALDPVRYRSARDYSERERSLAYRVVQGDRPFGEHAVATQGIPWRCSERAFLLEAADVIEALDEAFVRREFSVAEMVALGVYKTRPDDDEGETFARAMGNLRWLARYYREVAAYGYDLIVIAD